MTIEEYEEQAKSFTNLELKKLKNYIKKIDCWLIVSKLKHPKKFANFLKNDQNKHCSKKEINDYNNYLIDNDLC